MAEEEVRKQGEEFRDFKEQLAKKDQRIEELEAYLMRALLRIEELERRLRKDSHKSVKYLFPWTPNDGYGWRTKQSRKGNKNHFFAFQLAHPFHTILTEEVKGRSECDP